MMHKIELICVIFKIQSKFIDKDLELFFRLIYSNEEYIQRSIKYNPFKAKDLCNKNLLIILV